ncbi:MAG: methionyl-tRNA formyltransferase [Phycisphaerales bacterium]|nr:methionyl-tRNA formyltransferase [Phycisphaerales bacterium]
MKILFLGSGEFGLPTLQSLAPEHTIVGVVTQPDRPAGRGGQLKPTPIGEFAATLNVPLWKPEKINAPEIASAIRALNADAWVVIAFGQKLGRALLDGVFAINLHASRLPRWRGAAPINAAILAGDPITGNSIITLADRMDAGLVLAQDQRPIEPQQTAGELHDLLAQDGVALVRRVLEQHSRGEIHGVAQDESLATIAPKLSKADGWVDFAAPAEACRRRVHGLTPWPGVTVTRETKPDQPIKLSRVEVLDTHHQQQDTGTLVDAERGIIACGGGALRIIELQPAGKRVMAWDEFARGNRPERGERWIGRAACN